MMSYILFIMSEPSDPNNLYRISIQITNSQYKLLKHYSRPGTSISSIIRRAIDEMFEPVREQAIENAKYEKWEKETLANKDVMPEAPEIKWENLQPKQTTNAAS